MQGHIHIHVLRMVQLNKRKKTEPNLRYSWVSLCDLFVLLLAVLLHHSLVLEWMRQTASSLSHISGKLPGMGHVKTSLLGLSLQTHHRTTVAFVLLKTVYPLMKKRWKRNMKADTIQDT